MDLNVDFFRGRHFLPFVGACFSESKSLSPKLTKKSIFFFLCLLWSSPFAALSGFFFPGSFLWPHRGVYSLRGGPLAL